MSLHGCAFAMHEWHVDERPFASSLPKPCSFHPGHPRWSTTFSAHQHARPTHSSTAHLPNFAHTPKRSFRQFTLHSNPPLCLPLQLRKSYCTPSRFALLDLRHLSPVLPTNPEQHVHEVRGEQRPLLVVKLGHAMKGRPRRLQDLFSSTESLQVARHPLAHDRFQLASKFDSAKPQHKNFRVIRRSGVSRKSAFTARQVSDQSLLQSAHPCSATALAESSLDVQVRAEQLSAKQWSRRQQNKTWSLVPCVYKQQESLWNVPEL